MQTLLKQLAYKAETKENTLVVCTVSKLKLNFFYSQTVTSDPLDTVMKSNELGVD